MSKNTKPLGAKDIISWNNLSRYETDGGTVGSIRANRVPEKYKERIDELLRYIQSWMDTEELLTTTQAKAKVREEVEGKLKELQSKYKEIGKEIQDIVDNTF